MKRIIGGIAIGMIVSGAAYYFANAEIADRLKVPTPPVQITAASPEEKGALIRDLEAIRERIAKAETDRAAFQGGLLAALIDVRLETLRITEALLDQKLKALEAGAAFTYSVSISKPDMDRVEKLSREIGNAEAKASEAERQARETGGMISSLHALTAATHRHTVAMLEQETLAAKYGLRVPTFTTPPAAERAADAKDATNTADGNVSQPRVDQPKRPNITLECVEYVSQDVTILERNSVFHQFAWKVELRNKCDRALQVSVDFVFLDKDKFEIDAADGASYVGPNSVAIVRGRKLISPPEKAARVFNTEARWLARE